MADEYDIEEIMQGATAVNPDITIDQLLRLAEDRDMLERLLENATKIRILILGKTGVGKSTLINGLIGREVAEVKLGLSTTGVTREVAPYERRMDDLDVVVYDSPGLQDGSGNEEIYLHELYETCKDVDLIIFAFRMDNRFPPRNPDALAMVNFTRKFGPEVWKKSMTIITCANVTESLNPHLKSMPQDDKKKFFETQMETYKSAVHNTLINVANVPEEIVRKIKVIPTGHQSEARLLDNELWFSRFWLECLSIISTTEARVYMFTINRSRLRTELTVTPSELSQPLPEQPIVIPNHTTLGQKTVKIIGALTSIAFAIQAVRGITTGRAPYVTLGVFMGIAAGLAAYLVKK